MAQTHSSLEDDIYEGCSQLSVVHLYHEGYNGVCVSADGDDSDGTIHPSLLICGGSRPSRELLTPPGDPRVFPGQSITYTSSSFSHKNTS